MKDIIISVNGLVSKKALLIVIILLISSFATGCSVEIASHTNQHAVTDTKDILNEKSRISMRKGTFNQISEALSDMQKHCGYTDL